MNADVLGIGFDGAELLVRSAHQEVLHGVATEFRAMLGPPGHEPIGELEVLRAGGRYEIRGGLEPQETDGSLGDILRAVRYQVTLRFIAARPDLLWLHAAAAAQAGRAVLISGPAGHGKSTLVTALAARGWLFLADDVVPLDLAVGSVLPFPPRPSIRVDPGAELPAHAVADLARATIRISPDAVARGAARLEMLVFPTYARRSAPGLRRCSPGEATLELLRGALNYPAHEQTAVPHVAALCRRLPAYRLWFDDAARAGELVARAHAESPPS